MTDDTIRILLADLGRTADEIAASLAAAGIAGAINEPCECAIARYIRANGYKSVGVVNADSGPGGPRDCFQVEATGSDGYVIGDSGPIADFIRAFDREEYPHLIAGSGW
jgi:hypothetical protein